MIQDKRNPTRLGGGKNRQNFKSTFKKPLSETLIPRTGACLLSIHWKASGLLVLREKILASSNWFGWKGGGELGCNGWWKKTNLYLCFLCICLFVYLYLCFCLFVFVLVFRVWLCLYLYLRPRNSTATIDVKQFPDTGYFGFMRIIEGWKRSERVFVLFEYLTIYLKRFQGWRWSISSQFFHSSFLSLIMAATKCKI